MSGDEDPSPDAEAIAAAIRSLSTDAMQGQWDLVVVKHAEVLAGGLGPISDAIQELPGDLSREMVDSKGECNLVDALVMIARAITRVAEAVEAR